ncbi:DUF559 domain-containing protein [Candidatus Woesearchaeota archaeon]|nr:DUF559 domain-containing protein [Candidatus Woesearchaeota archaeon]
MEPIQKEMKARSRSTPTALKLHDELRLRGISSYCEFWDGYKHIDLAIPSHRLNIEVDGEQHNLNPKQALADLKRTYYSFQKGYFTLRIPNSLVHSNFSECVELIMQIIGPNGDKSKI